jgi:CheY-like chemotaxis protein
MVKPVMLVAEDDDMDAVLLEHALQRTGSAFQMIRVLDGIEAIDYLKGAGTYGDRSKFPLPNLLLLDLKMPRKDGFGFLQWRLESSRLKGLPVIAFSSSDLRADVERAYQLGANSFVNKPTAPKRLDELLRALYGWWIAFNLSGPHPTSP